MNFEQFYSEATRRDFLKKLGGALVGSQLPGGKAAAKVTKAAAPALKTFKVLNMGYYRHGETELHGGVRKVVARSVADAVKKVAKQYQDEARDDYLEALEVDREELSPEEFEMYYGQVPEWVQNDPNIDNDEWFSGYEFFEPYRHSEEDGIGSGGRGEEEGFFVIGEENPLFKTISDKGFFDDPEELEQVLIDWEDSDWETAVENAQERRKEFEDEMEADRRSAEEMLNNDIEYSPFDYAGGSETSDIDKYHREHVMTFKQFFLEYFKGDPILNPRMQNGKDPNRIHMRKHMNTKPMEYSNMHPDVENVAKGRANNVMVQGARLQNLLQMYNLTFSPGTKGLGRTHAVLIMKQTPQGPVGIIKQK
jgi:hypothetical protein